MSDFFLKKLVRIIVITGLAFVIALFLFYFMSVLISKTPSLIKGDRMTGIIEFIRTKPRSFLEERKRKLPQKRSKDKPPPFMSRPKEVSKPMPKNKLKINKISLKAALKGTGPAVGSFSGMAGVGGTPLVRINPQYPRKARMLGIEGQVTLQFTITPIGSVTDIRVLHSHPKDIFEQAAIQAVSKWKYQPLMEDGKPVKQENIQVQIDFTLENE